MLADGDDVPLTGDGAVLAATFSTLERAPGPARHIPSRHTESSAPNAPTRSTQPTTNPPTTTPTPTSTAPAPPSQPSTPTVPAPPSDPDPAPSNQPDMVVTLVNQVRATAGCAPLVVDEHLTAAAAGHSSDMSDRTYFSHTTPEGVEFDARIKSAGYPLPGAENIARGQRSASQVMDAWMTSPGHKANILNCDLKTIGVGLDTDGWYWTQDFGY
jgi:uncharacterized protein YkwD